MSRKRVRRPRIKSNSPIITFMKLPRTISEIQKRAVSISSLNSSNGTVNDNKAVVTELDVKKIIDIAKYEALVEFNKCSPEIKEILIENAQERLSAIQ